MNLETYKRKTRLRIGALFLVLFLVFAMLSLNTSHSSISDKHRTEYNSIWSEIERLDEQISRDNERLPLEEKELYLMNSLTRLSKDLSMRYDHNYVMATLLDSEYSLLAKSGTWLSFLANGFLGANNITQVFIPLDMYMNETQKIQLRSVYKKSWKKRKAPILQSANVKGFFSEDYQFVPQSITMNFVWETYTMLTDTKKVTARETLAFEFQNAMPHNAALQEVDVKQPFLSFPFSSRHSSFYPKPLSNWEQQRYDALLEAATSQRLYGLALGGGGTVDPIARANNSLIFRFEIGDRTFYLSLITRSYLLQAAIEENLVSFLFLLAIMFFLYLIVTRNFITTYKERLAMEESQRSLTTGIAHELKTPLGVIRNYSEGILEGINKSKEDHYLNVIIDETKRMDNMIVDMLTLSNFKEMATQLHKQSCNVKKMFDTVITPYQPLLDVKQLKLNVEADSTFTLQCDKKLIEQVLSNFLSNAIKNTPKGGTILFRVHSNIDSMKISVINEGEPLSETTRKHIWEPFYKGDKARTDRSNTGLGLSVAKSILQAHGFIYSARNTKTGVCFSFVAIQKNRISKH